MKVLDWVLEEHSGSPRKLFPEVFEKKLATLLKFFEKVS